MSRNNLLHEIGRGFVIAGAALLVLALMWLSFVGAFALHIIFGEK